MTPQPPEQPRQRPIAPHGLPSPDGRFLWDAAQAAWVPKETWREAAAPDPVASRQRWDYDEPHPFESKDLGNPTYDFCICERRRTDAMHLPDPVASPPEALRLLNTAIQIIEHADHRASAADGPVNHVRDELTDAEWRVMYEALTEARRFLEGAVASPAPLDALADALEAEGFVRGVASRYGTFNRPYWEQSAAAILRRLEGQPVAEEPRG